jgi:LAO/AO transport system kinase
MMFRTRAPSGTGGINAARNEPKKDRSGFATVPFWRARTTGRPRTVRYSVATVRRRNPPELVQAAVAGNRTSLARLLSIVEEGGPLAQQAASLVWPKGGQAYTVGITGSPGAGKSTLTDQLITCGRKSGSDMAILAIDPSSPYTGGAILGDRVRMGDHFTDEGVFIRSMATRGHLGGLALAAPEAVRVLDAAGFPWVLIETVGVGQVEVDIAGNADTTVVVVNPGWGDSVQANKAGIMEIADIFVINKADRKGAAETQRDLEGMMDLSGFGHDAWRPPVLRTVAATGDGVDALWTTIAEHRARIVADGTLQERREKRLRAELLNTMARIVESRVLSGGGTERFEQLLAEVIARRIDPGTAASTLLDTAS